MADEPSTPRPSEGDPPAPGPQGENSQSPYEQGSHDRADGSDARSARASGSFGAPGEPAFGQSRFHLDPDDTPTVPNLFARGDLPPGSWAAAGAAGATGAAGAAGTGGGSTGGPAPGVPADQQPSHGDGQFGVQVASTLPPRSERRRGALLAVGLVALATAVVVAAALLIGPHLGGGQADDGDAAPPATPSWTSSVSGAPSGTPSLPTLNGAVPPPVDPTGAPTVLPDSSTTDPVSTTSRQTPSVVTVTVTAGSSRSTATRGHGHGTRSATSATRAASSTTTASSTRTTPTRSSATVVYTTASSTTTSSTTRSTTTRSDTSRYGVPIKQIHCGDGYIVQLASELTPSAFAHRVAELQDQGLVPSDAKAADSRKSCRLFTGQTNTLILYAGPFSDRYDACPDRLAGPYDAFIRGASPDTSDDFVSCICPASAGALPWVSHVGATGQWIGELQRMLAAHLNYSIPDLGIGTWGQYTPDTRAAVERFQHDHHLRDNGVVGRRTWRALQHEGC